MATTIRVPMTIAGQVEPMVIEGTPEEVAATIKAMLIENTVFVGLGTTSRVAETPEEVIAAAERNVPTASVPKKMVAGK